tara:strand:- start:16910 stop:18352 length:1443 start_codon:yes stop_codon:yes gene_type:complete
MFQPNEMVKVEDLVRLNEALRKSDPTGPSGYVGHQTGASPDAGGSLSALVPQSIEGMLSVATHTMDEIKLWKNIPKVSVNNTLHEYVRVDEHGLDLDPFIAEGGGGSDFATGQGNYSRESVKIKYMAERRQISDVASMVGMIGDNRNALAEETERGTLSLMRKVEQQLWHGNESLNSNGFDGIIKQIKDNGNSLDLKGAVPSPLLLQEVLGEVYASPNYGRPDTIYVEPRIHSELIRQSVENGRHDMFVRNPAQGITFGQQDIFISAPYGKVKVESAPFLHTASNFPSANIGSFGGTFANPAVTAVSDGATTQQTRVENGAYYVEVVAIDAKGAQRSTLSATVTTANNNEKIKVDFDASDAGILYYRVYISKKDGALSTLKKIKEVAGGTDFVYITGDDAYNSSPIVFAQHTPDALQFVRLMDLIRRPLAETSTVKPFLLMLFGSPLVKLPKKMFVLEQAGFTDTSGLGDDGINYLTAKF